MSYRLGWLGMGEGTEGRMLSKVGLSQTREPVSQTRRSLGARDHVRREEGGGLGAPEELYVRRGGFAWVSQER
jgi:hypothetical protein